MLIFLGPRGSAAACFVYCSVRADGCTSQCFTCPRPAECLSAAPLARRVPRRRPICFFVSHPLLLCAFARPRKPLCGASSLSACSPSQGGADRSIADNFGCGAFAPSDARRHIDLDITAMHYTYSELVVKRGCTGGRYERGGANCAPLGATPGAWGRAGGGGAPAAATKAAGAAGGEVATTRATETCAPMVTMLAHPVDRFVSAFHQASLTNAATAINPPLQLIVATTAIAAIGGCCCHA